MLIHAAAPPPSSSRESAATSTTPRREPERGATAWATGTAPALSVVGDASVTPPIGAGVGMAWLLWVVIHIAYQCNDPGLKSYLRSVVVNPLPSLTHIMERLNIGAPTVSHHLKELVNADLVRTERVGKFVRCRVNEEAVGELRGFFSFLAA